MHICNNVILIHLFLGCGEGRSFHPSLDDLWNARKTRKTSPCNRSQHCDRKFCRMDLRRSKHSVTFDTTLISLSYWSSSRQIFLLPTEYPHPTAFKASKYQEILKIDCLCYMKNFIKKNENIAKILRKSIWRLKNENNNKIILYSFCFILVSGSHVFIVHYLYFYTIIRTMRK